MSRVPLRLYCERNTVATNFSYPIDTYMRQWSRPSLLHVTPYGSLSVRFQPIKSMRTRHGLRPNWITLTNCPINIFCSQYFSNTFSSIKLFVFWFKFNWHLFMRIQLTLSLSKHWLTSGQGSALTMWQAFTWTNADMCRILILQWRHNERHSVSNRRQVNCLFNHMVRGISTLRVTGLFYTENPPVTPH